MITTYFKAKKVAAAAASLVKSATLGSSQSLSQRQFFTLTKNNKQTIDKVVQTSVQSRAEQTRYSAPPSYFYKRIYQDIKSLENSKYLQFVPSIFHSSDKQPPKGFEKFFKKKEQRDSEKVAKSMKFEFESTNIYRG